MTVNFKKFINKMLIRKIITCPQLVQSGKIHQRLVSTFRSKGCCSTNHIGLSSSCCNIFSNNIAGCFSNSQCKTVRFLSTNYLTSFINNTNGMLLCVPKDIGQQFRGYAMRLELTEYGLLWKKPEPIPEWKPEHSGDLVPFEEPDKTLPVVSMMNVASDIAKADEKVQRLLSLEFSSERAVIDMAKYLLKRRVQQHKYDKESWEVKIANQTVTIRYLQRYLPVCKKRSKKKTPIRIYLQELIAKRKRNLRILRKTDYKKFEWLLEELNIVYKPYPKYKVKVSRKGSLRLLVNFHCEELKRLKLEKYKLELEPLKKPFLEEKRQTLKWIAETEKRLGVPVSVVVPEEEEEVKKLSDGGQNSQTSS